MPFLSFAEREGIAASSSLESPFYSQELGSNSETGATDSDAHLHAKREIHRPFRRYQARYPGCDQMASKQLKSK